MLKLTHGLERSTRIHPDRTALIFGDRRKTWRTVHDRVTRIAGALVGMGLKPGDRVYAIGGNSDLYVEHIFAVLWAGGIPAPGNTRWTLPEHRQAVSDCAPRLIFADPVFADDARILATEAGIDLILLDHEAGNGRIPTIEELTRSEPIADRSGADDELALLIFTGGTTGRSKAVMLSHKSLLMVILSGAPLRRLYPGVVVLHNPPFYHLAALGLMFATTMLGGTHVIAGAFDTASFIDIVGSERVEVVSMVPTMFALLADYLEQHPADLGSVRHVGYGASSITTGLLRKAMEIFPNAIFMQGYGQSELSGSATTLEPAYHDRDGKYEHLLRSAGLPHPFTELRICDSDLNDLPAGEVGEVLVRGPGVMLGYWNQPELTARTIVDGWVRTGDAGYLDESGFLFIVDRIKDMIVTGGENVYCAEVENALAQHPDVQEVAIIGVADDRWGERVHAVVRLHPHAKTTAEELLAHARTLIAGFKVPRSIDFTTAPLPATGAGKISKVELRRRYSEAGSALEMPAG